MEEMQLAKLHCCHLWSYFPTDLARDDLTLNPAVDSLLAPSQGTMDVAGPRDQASSCVRLEVGLLPRTSTMGNQKMLECGCKRVGHDNDRTNDGRLGQPRWLMTRDAETSQIKENL